jgi:hypothetical protein
MRHYLPHALPQPSPISASPLEVQIRRIEHGEAHQRLAIKDRERLLLERDQPQRAQVHERAVDVHGRDADGVGQLLLGERERAAIGADEAHGLEPDEDLAKQVRQPLRRRALADAGDPGACNRLLDVRMPLERRLELGWAPASSLRRSGAICATRMAVSAATE